MALASAELVRTLRGMNNKKYEYATVIGNVRIRERRPDESPFEHNCAPMSDLLIVDNPVPPSDGDWELVTTIYVMTKEVRWFVGREWRRALPTTDS